MNYKFLYRFLLITVLFSATPLKAQMTLSSARDIYIAASDGNTVSLYYSQNNINMTDSNGNTALCMAYQNGDWKSYSLLMRYGASANVDCMKGAYVYRAPVAATTTAQTSTAAAGTSVMSGGAAGTSSGTFLGMGAIGWTTVGVLAAGGITAAALGGGGGGGGGSNKCKNVNCGAHGTCNAGQCVCEEGYAGTSCETCASGFVEQDGACYKEIGGCTKYNPSTGYCVKCENYNVYYLSDGKCNIRTNTTDCANFVETADQCTSCSHTMQYYYSDYKCNLRNNTTGCTQFNPNADICTYCDVNDYYLSGGSCHERTHKDGCTVFDSNTDQCTSCDADHYLKNGVCLVRQNKDNCSNYKADEDVCLECTDITEYYLDSGKCTQRTNKSGCHTFNPNVDKCTSCINETQYDLIDGICVARTACTQLDPSYVTGDSEICTSGLYVCTFAEELADHTKCYTYTPNDCSSYHATSSEGCTSYTDCKNPDGTFYQCTACDTEAGWVHTADDTCEPKDCSQYFETCPAGYKPTEVKCIAGGKSYYSCEIINNGTKTETEEGDSPKVTYGKNLTDGSYAEMAVLEANQNIYNAAGTVDENNSYSAGNSTLTVDNQYYSVPVYGMYVESSDSAPSYEVYNAYSKNSDVHSSGSINIEQKGSNAEKIVGIAVDNKATSSNATVVNAGQSSQGTISVSYTGTGTAKVYGIETKGTAYNNKNGTVGTITAINNGNGDTFGITGGETVYNSYSGEGVIELEVSGSGNAYGLDSASIAHNADDSSGTATGTIKITHKGSGDSYGISALSGSNAGMSNGNGTGWTIFADGGEGTGDIYGFYTDGNASSFDSAVNSWGGGTGYITSFAKTDNTYSTSLLTSTHGKVYGMYAPNGATLYNAKNNEGYDTNATIALTVNASQELHGMYSAGQAYNAMSDSSSEKANASIIINNTNGANGQTYGMYAGDPMNAYTNNSSSSAEGLIDVSTTANGNAYGIYGSGTTKSVINAYIDENITGSSVVGNVRVSKTSSTGEVNGIYGSSSVFNVVGDSVGENSSITGKVEVSSSSSGMVIGLKGAYTSNVSVVDSDENSSLDGTIKVEATSNGNAYGMNATKSAQNVYNTNSGTATGTIEVTHEGSGEAYGISALSGTNVYSENDDSTGWIILGDGETGTGGIYGMFITGTPSETSPVNAYNVQGGGTGYITSFTKQNTSDEDYTSSLLTATHQKVYGMYAPNGATLINAQDMGGFDVTGNIFLKANAGQGLYGMATSTGDLYNITSTKSSQSTASIMVENTSDNGPTYGLYTTSGTAYNASAKGTEGTIVSKNTSLNGGGNAYGIFSENGNVYNAVSGGHGIIEASIGDSPSFSTGIYTNKEAYNASETDSEGEIIAQGAAGKIRGIVTSQNAYNGYKGGNGTIRVGGGTADTVLAYGIYGDLENGTIRLYNAYEGTGLITDKGADDSILLGSSNLVYGIYGSGENVIAYNAYADLDEDEEGEYDGDETADATGDIILETTGNGEMIGIYAGGTESNFVVNAYNYENGTVTGTIKLVSTNNDEDIYGIKVENAGTVYNAATDSHATTTGNINITAQVDEGSYSGDVFGICVSGTAVARNAYEKTGNINITSSSTGQVYGIKGDSAVSNAVSSGTGKIDISSSVFSQLYGIYAGGDATNASSDSTGNITVSGKSDESGDGFSIYGIYSLAKAYNAIGIGAKGTITVEDKGDHEATGIYTRSEAYNGYNGGTGNIILKGESNYSAFCGIEGNGSSDSLTLRNAQDGTGTITNLDGSTILTQNPNFIYGIRGYNSGGSVGIINSYATSRTSQATINLASSDGQNSIYGIYGESDSATKRAVRLVNAYNDTSTPESVTSTGTITLSTSSSATSLWGICGHGQGSVTNAEGYSTGGYSKGDINLTINNTNGRSAYGLYSEGLNPAFISDVYMINANINSEGSINITSNGSRDIYGMYSTDRAAFNALNPGAIGKITVTTNGSGNAYGMYNISAGGSEQEPGITSNSTSGGKGTITVTSNSAGAAVGMYAKYGALYNFYKPDGSQTPDVEANIIVTSTGSGSAYGMYSEGGNVYNGIYGQTAGSIITVDVEGTGKAYGIYKEGSGSVYNYGKISVTSYGGNVYGIYSKDSAKVYNEGVIEIHGDTDTDNSMAVGIYAGVGSTVYNDGMIIIGGGFNSQGIPTKDDEPGSHDYVYGIYSLGDVYNDGSIILYSGYGSGREAGLYVSKQNDWTSGSVDLDYHTTSYDYTRWGPTQPSGTIHLEGCWNSGNCEDIEEYYKVYVGNADPLSAPAKLTNAGTFSSPSPLNFVTEGNAQVLSMPTAVWQAPAIKGDITMSSEIVDEGFETTYHTTGTFDVADLSNLNLLSQSALFNASLDSNQTDVTLSMKEFSDVVENNDIASFLSENYTLQNNEEMFAQVKSIETASELNKSLDQMFGKEVFSRFMFEDLTMMREMNFDMNNKLFSNDKDYFETAGSVTPFAFDGNSGSNGRYSLTSTSYGNKSIGISAAFSDIRSDDGDLHNSNHRKETSFVVSLPMGYKTHGFHLISTPKLGYAYGTYERKGFEGTTYDGTLQKRIYALTNELRYPVKLGSWTLSPSIEANFIGYQMKGHEDEDGASPLVIPNQERYSLASGFGLYATREVEFLQNGKLSFNIGGSVYHEFLDPYEMKLGVRKMNGYVNLRDEKRGDNFGIVRTGFDFNLGDITLSGHLNSYIDNSYHSEAKLGLKYAF